ncbi:hypothetical protein BDQ17DRAFT_1432484 [Cyathus striatus]|nr:hypothetical protein BDQ17DRAFT_1432484 [Cyathus striatus]
MPRSVTPLTQSVANIHSCSKKRGYTHTLKQVRRDGEGFQVSRRYVNDGRINIWQVGNPLSYMQLALPSRGLKGEADCNTLVHLCTLSPVPTATSLRYRSSFLSLITSSFNIHLHAKSRYSLEIRITATSLPTPTHPPSVVHAFHDTLYNIPSPSIVSTITGLSDFRSWRAGCKGVSPITRAAYQYSSEENGCMWVREMKEMGLGDMGDVDEDFSLTGITTYLENMLGWRKETEVDTSYFRPVVHVEYEARGIHRAYTTSPFPPACNALPGGRQVVGSFVSPLPHQHLGNMNGPCHHTRNRSSHHYAHLGLQLPIDLPSNVVRRPLLIQNPHFHLLAATTAL